MTETTALAKHEPKAALVTGGHVAAIIPRSIEETFRLATAIHASGLAPQTLKGPDSIMVAILAGAELGLAPFQSLQSFAVINGRPSIWGDGLMAVVRSNGFKVKEWTEGEGEQMVAHCEVTRPDTAEVIPGKFSVADARKAGLWGKPGPWQSYPPRMLKMRARAFALRDGAADVLRGFQIREEVEDYAHVRDITPQKSGVMARLEQHGSPGAPGFVEGAVEAEIARPLAPDAVDAIIEEVAEVEQPAEAVDATFEEAQTAEPEIPFPGDEPSSFDVLGWASTLLRALPDYAGVDVLRADWTAHKDELKAHSPDAFKQLNRAVADRAIALGAK